MNACFHPLGQLDKDASLKGFVAVPEGATGRIRLLDTLDLANGMRIGGGGASVSFDSIESARAWVKTLNRDLPDITPALDVPIELAAKLPTEPVQAININHQVAEHLANAVGDLSPQSGLSGQARTLLAQGQIGTVANMYTQGVAKFQPMSTLMAKMDDVVRGAGFDLPFAKMYTDVLHAHDQMVTYKAPFQQEIGTILSKVRESKATSGEWTRVYEIEDPTVRLAAATKAGFNPGEISALDEVDAFARRMFPETGLDPARQIARYISHIGERQSMGMGSKSWEDFPLSEVTQPFYEMYRSGNLNAREMDPRNLWGSYLNSLGWKKHLAEPFAQVAADMQGISETHPDLKPFTDVFGNWLKTMRYGYQVEDDAALTAMHSVAQTFLGPEVTLEQTRNMFSNGLNSTQNALLGFRPHILVRDGLRLFYAAAKIGVGDVMGTLNEYATGGEAAQRSMWDWAISKGIARQNLPNIRAPGYFEAAQPSFGEPAVEGASLRNRVANTIYTTIADKMPASLRDPSPGELSPLYWIGKQAEWMRMIAGKSMYDKTNAALNVFRAAGENGSVDQLLGDSGMRTLDPAYQHVFMQHVASGDNEAAATFAARQMTDMTMFRYGQLESPIISRSVMGRIGLQLGNYGLHTYQFVKSSLTNGTTADKVRFLALFGGVTAGLEAAKSASGWDFGKMNPLEGLGFSGGPWMEASMDAVKAGGSLISTAMDPDRTQPYDTPTLGGVVGNAAAMLNPLAGLYRGAQAIGNASQSPSPMSSIARYAITGQVDNGPDIDSQMVQGAHDAMLRSMEPMSGPVRAGAWGSTQIVPQVQVSPPLLTLNPNNMTIPVPTQDNAMEHTLQGVPPEIAQIIMRGMQEAHNFPQMSQQYGGRVPYQHPVTGASSPSQTGIP